MNSILMVIIGLLVLGVLVFVHELGHFLVAKWCGIRVLAFSLGFGTPILKKSIGDTEYRLSAIPFGGYVKMAGENPEDETQGAPDEFTSQPVWKRAAVAIAGPASNFFFALLMLWVVYLWGVEHPLYLERPILGAVSDSSAAKTAGLQAGDSLISINGKQINSWDDIETVFAQQEKKYKITYSRNSKSLSTTLHLKNTGGSLPKQPFAGLQPPLPAVVAQVNENSPASKSGMMPGDTIKAIDGQKVHSWFQLIEIIKEWQPNNPLRIAVKRNDSLLSMSMKPEFDEQTGRKLLGIHVSEGKTRIIRYSPVPAAGKALDKSWEYTIMIFDVIGKLISREVSANQLAGPIGIIPASGLIFFQGLSPLLNFMALIGINLAVLNLMPLVITDGGLLFFLLLEAIRRKPLSVKTQMTINKIAIAFFMLLFLFITFNDVKRLPDYFRFFGK